MWTSPHDTPQLSVSKRLKERAELITPSWANITLSS